MEDKRGEEAAEVATTAVEPPNSTTSAMEAGGSGEGPNSRVPPACTAPVEKPLEHLMRDMGLETKGGHNFSHHPRRQASSL